MRDYKFVLIVSTLLDDVLDIPVSTFSYSTLRYGVALVLLESLQYGDTKISDLYNYEPINMFYVQ